jgi:hypothetical protein
VKCRGARYLPYSGQSLLHPFNRIVRSPGSRMLKQAVGVLASIVAIAIVSLAVAVLVRLSWYPRSDPGETPPKT